MCCNGLFLIVEVPVVVAVSTASSHNSNITTGERTDSEDEKKSISFLKQNHSFGKFKKLLDV